MPYAGVNDETLPDNIKKLPENKRSAFVQAFNTTIQDCDGNEQECEERAFAVASTAAQQAGQKDTSILTVDDSIKDKTYTGPARLPGDFIGAETGFKVLSTSIPRTEWIAWYANAYRDRDGEIFATEALEKAARRFQTGEKAMPELQFWHMPPTRHGVATWVVKAGRFLVAGGTFDDSELAAAFKAYYAVNAVELSHGFEYNPRDLRDGVYYDFSDFEISTIPKDANKASNPYTAYLIGEKRMASFTEEQLAVLTEVLGEDRARSIIEAGQKASEELDEAGVAYKEEKKKPKKKPSSEQENMNDEDKAEDGEEDAEEEEKMGHDKKPKKKAMPEDDHLAIMQQNIDRLEGSVATLIKAVKMLADSESEESDDRPRSAHQKQFTSAIVDDYEQNNKMQIGQRSTDPVSRLIALSPLGHMLSGGDD